MKIMRHNIKEDKIDKAYKKDKHIPWRRLGELRPYSVSRIIGNFYLKYRFH